ncbi:hypothetical protein CCO02nite_07320 [Cellulomonas composti]|uniref:Uncharacterized protein n=1 Tax=Cellulomonas composti TaxID=266130 RepID=A0A511J7X9_9CELL|nr:hypothetical protein CCO02nite_07320 [Cellulomonas composti]
MRVLENKPTIKNPPEWFTGDVWLDLLATPQEGDQRMVVGLVRFAPGRGPARIHRHVSTARRLTVYDRPHDSGLLRRRPAQQP